jgi:hypothetical protein
LIDETSREASFIGKVSEILVMGNTLKGKSHGCYWCETKPEGCWRGKTISR